jgi:hypothetical protein
MKRIFLLALLLLIACTKTMTEDEIHAAMDKCMARGRTPMPMVHLDGHVAEVQCW